MGDSCFVLKDVQMRSLFTGWPQALGVLAASAILTACAATPAKPGDSGTKTATAPSPAATTSSTANTTDLYPSTYTVPASTPTLIRHATVLTGTGTRLDDADVLIVDGKIQSVGTNLAA